MRDEILDLKEALERVQDDQELLKELFEIFEGDYPEKRKQLDKAFKSKNPTELKNVAHSLKGASSNISAKQMYASFSKLEKMAEQGDIAQADQILIQIDREYAELKTYMGTLKAQLK